MEVLDFIGGEEAWMGHGTWRVWWVTGEVIFKVLVKQLLVSIFSLLRRCMLKEEIISDESIEHVVP